MTLKYSWRVGALPTNQCLYRLSNLAFISSAFKHCPKTLHQPFLTCRLIISEFVFPLGTVLKLKNKDVTTGFHLELKGQSSAFLLLFTVFYHDVSALSGCACCCSEEAENVQISQVHSTYHFNLQQQETHAFVLTLNYRDVIC